MGKRYSPCIVYVSSFMLIAPFCLVVSSNDRILVFGYICKCAILFFQLALHGRDGAGDLREAHLRDVPGSHTQRIEGLRCIEVHNAPEVIVREVVRWVNTTAGKKHICHTVLQGAPILYLNIQIVQFLQKAVFFVVVQLLKVVLHIVLHGVLCRRDQRRGKGVFVFQFTEAVFQSLRDLLLIFSSHCPDRDTAGEASGVSVGYIKVIFQPCAACSVAVKHGDARRASVDPAPKLAIPFVDLQYSGGVRALSIE